jgi:hypothetical protein
MLATIKNESKQPVVLILDHQAFANKASGWKRTTAHFGSSNADGTRTVKEVRRSYPGTLTIQPGESVKDLHAAIVHCAQMPSLLARKVLSVTYAEPAAPAQEKA